MCCRGRRLEKYQDFSRVTTRSAGRVRRFSKSRGSSPVGSGGLRNLTNRVGSGRVRRVSNLTGRVGSHPGPTRPAICNPTRPAIGDPTRENPGEKRVLSLSVRM